MHRMTTGAFVLFVLLCLTLTILSGKRRTSVMEDVPVAIPVETTETGEGTDPAMSAPIEEPAIDDTTTSPEPADEA